MATTDKAAEALLVDMKSVTMQLPHLIAGGMMQLTWFQQL